LTLSVASATMIHSAMSTLNMMLNVDWITGFISRIASEQ